MKSNFDYDSDAEYLNYTFYKNRLINARTYELVTRLKIKILLPINHEEDLNKMLRRNRLLQLKNGEFHSFKLNLKDYRFVNGVSSLIGVNRAIRTCMSEFGLNQSQLLAMVTIYGFQIFSRNDAIDILRQSQFKNAKGLFFFFVREEYLMRIDDLSKNTKVDRRVYCISKKGLGVVRRFYDIIESSTVFDFKFKSKSELLVDDILKRFE